MSDEQTTPAVPTVLLTKVEISIKCQKLLNKDVTSKSDPMVAVYIEKFGKGWVEVGRTENISNCLDPDFAVPIAIDYFFEEVQKLSFQVYDIDNATNDLNDDDYMGGAEVTLSQIVARTPLTLPLLLRNGPKASQSTITLIAEEVGASRTNLQLSFTGKGLDKKDFFGKSDPYLEIFRQAPDGSGVLIHRTEVVKNSLSPAWKVFTLPGSRVNSNNAATQLKINCYDYDDDGAHDFIGEVETTVGELMKAVDSPMEWSCINPKKAAKKSSYKDSGKIILASCETIQEFTFLDYIFGGCQLNFTVGIDFTASNGDPRNPNSLHHYDDSRPNEYMQAISAVGAIIQDYDSDKMFPALGFGARIPPGTEVMHEFALNFDPSNPFCSGIQGIIEAYKECLPRVQLYGPTNIAPILYHVTRFAETAHQEPKASNYFVLLLLTDGVITDMNETRRAIVHASQLPMSIIIVGVGDADFTDMRTLDGDDGCLKSPEGTPVARDIVQFVHYRKFQQVGMLDFQTASSQLAKEVLAEIPKQVVDYYRMRGLPPPTVPVDAMQALNI